MSDGESTAPVRAGIVATGTEVVTATIADRNGPWIAEQLTALGVEVAFITSVGDRREDMRRVLGFLRDGGLDLVFTTGGLGPTADDLTAEVVAELTGREMELDAGMEERIGEILGELARRQGLDPEALAAANRKQAMVPRGAIALSPVGTAPGLVVPGRDEDNAVFVVLPGPPRELQPMWEPALETAPVSRVLARVPPMGSAHLRLFGIPESELAQSLREIEAEGVETDRVEVTTCLRKGEIEVDLRWREGEEQAAEAIREGIARRHPRELYSVDGTTIDRIVGSLLEGRSVAVAESCTGGLLAARLTDPPGASGHFGAGLVTYSNPAKEGLLGVDPELLARHGAVSPEVAEAMARGALQRAAADTAVAITGVAGPGGGTEDKPVGYVCLHACTADGREVSRDPVIPGGRADVRERSALVAMHMLRQLLS